jgi:hypothetical protein
VGRRSARLGVYWGDPYGGDSWGYPRWWFPVGYGAYWYGPYWYDRLGYDDYEDRSAAVKLDVKPKTADVFVDGYFAGTVNDFDGLFQRLNVAPGSHRITVWCKGYRTVTNEVYAQRGNALKLKYEMEPLAAGEAQEPRPLPPPVADGRPEQRLAPRQPGRPGVPGIPRRPREPATPADPARQPQPASVVEAAGYASLAIKVQPADAQIFIDGEAWQSSQGSDRLVVHLPVGAHRIEIRKPGFKPFASDVQVRAGETTTLNVSLSGQESK